MDLVAGPVGSIIRKLGELLQAEYKLQKGLPQQIKTLKQEPESAHTALLKVGEVRPEQLDPQVRLWAREVREASYDMEDILDTFLVDVVEVADAPAEKKDSLRRRLKNMMDKLFKKSKARHTLAGAIEEMKKRLQEVADRRDRYSVEVAVAAAAPATRVDPRLAHMHQEAAQLIGIDRTKAELIAMLQSTSSHGIVGGGVSSSSSSSKKMKIAGSYSSSCSGSSKTKIVSVVGAGGLGKTTLAKAVYDQLMPEYDCGAFVSVGRKPDLVQVLTSIFFHLDRQEYNAIRELKDLHLLLGELRKFLRNKRYFIVIDDVWDLESWKAIKSALDVMSSLSRVIITTRNREVAGLEEMYELDPLSLENSKRLFYMRLFGAEDKCPANHPNEASEKILKKCGGVPLAIITMSSLLVGKSREAWFDVCNSPGFYRGKESKQVDDTAWILSLSYYDLPSHLKACLLYLSVYPEDYYIEKDLLIWKWIAEGFIPKNEGTGLYQQGEECFHELINRSMIQALVSEWSGEIYGCHVHDMVLDLIRGLSDEENFVTISNNDDGTSLQRNVRRLAYQNKTINQIGEDMPQARSLLAFKCCIDSWVLHPSLKLLRVLALENCTSSCSLDDNIRHLGNLLHLRYLGIQSNADMLELPDEIGALKHLQVLCFENTRSRQLQLPSSACMLTQLVCLRGSLFSKPILPDGFLGKVTSLEELDIHVDDLDVDPNRRVVEELGNLSQLRLLVINFGSVLGPRMQSVLLQSLGKLQKLQHLTLFVGYNKKETTTREWDTVVLPHPLRHLRLFFLTFDFVPRCINRDCLPNLSHLDLILRYMDEAGLRALGGLPELRHLELECDRRMKDSSKATIVAVDGFFPTLRRFSLKGWIVQFETNEQDTTSSSSTVSFSVWNGKGAMALASNKTDEECSSSSSRAVAPAAAVLMPNLQALEFTVPVSALYGDARSGRRCANLGLECIPSLHYVTAHLDRRQDATADDVEKAKAELRHAAQVHPNTPNLQLF